MFRDRMKKNMNPITVLLLSPHPHPMLHHLRIQFGFTSTMSEEEIMVEPTRGYALALRYKKSAGT